MDKRVCPVCGNEYSKEDLKSLNSRSAYGVEITFVAKGKQK